MEAQKSLSGKIELSKSKIATVAAFYSISIIVICAAFAIKLSVFDKVVFKHPVIAYFLLCFGIAFLMAAFFVYMAQSRRSLLASPKSLYAVATAVAFTYVLSIFMSLINIICMPVFLTAFIIAPISKRRDAFVGNIFTNFLIVFTLLIGAMQEGAVPVSGIFIMFLVGITFGSVAAYTVSSNTKRTNYVIKGFFIGITALALIMIFALLVTDLSQNVQEVVKFAGISMLLPLLLGLILQPLFESVFNLVTNSRLVEITDHSSPLIKRLRLETPGTFNHSLAVANFAEICATAIGENPYLARACAYYHDVGKLVNPSYFKENQGEVNPHDELLPEVSADIIRGHTTQGLALCEQYRIPSEVSHVTIQHHGTLLIPVFYKKAQQLTDGAVDQNMYSYHGVTPVTKVAAIIMLCDVGEAAIRAMDSPDGEKVDKLLTSLINSRIEGGQFDNCDISLRDLDTIKKTIISAYGGLFHKRMQYPDGDKKK